MLTAEKTVNINKKNNSSLQMIKHKNTTSYLQITVLTWDLGQVDNVVGFNWFLGSQHSLFISESLTVLQIKT